MFRSLERRLSKLFVASEKCLYSTKTYETRDNSVNAFLEQLSSEFNTNVSSIASVIEEENLDKVKLSEWNDRINFLGTYNFNSSDCFNMIKSYPNILKMPFNSLKNATVVWSTCRLGVDNFNKVLINQPQFLDLNLDDIREKIPLLFAATGSKNSLVTVLLKCPNVMFDNWNSTESKFEYLITKKGVERAQLIQSYALAHSLYFIQLRISILEKCGVFIPKLVKPHKKNKYDKTQHRNPHLKFILDTNDKVFSKKIAGITHEEYVVCEEMFSMNQFSNPVTDNPEEDNKDEDGDDDDDDDLSYKKH